MNQDNDITKTLANKSRVIARMRQAVVSGELDLTETEYTKANAIVSQAEAQLVIAERNQKKRR